MKEGVQYTAKNLGLGSIVCILRGLSSIKSEILSKQIHRSNKSDLDTSLDCNVHIRPVREHAEGM
jgi:hypothetical protein